MSDETSNQSEETPQLKPADLLGKGGKKEKIVREWFVHRFCEDDEIKYPTHMNLATIFGIFEDEYEGPSVSYGAVNGTFKKIKKELGIDDVQKPVFSKSARPGHGALNVVDANEELAAVDEDFEVDVHEIKDLEFPNVKLHKTGKKIDVICSDHEEDGGTYGGTVNIVVGESGAGKTTLLLDMLKDFRATAKAEGKEDLKLCYASSEMTRNDLYFYHKKTPAIGDVPTVLFSDYLTSGNLWLAVKQVFEGDWDIVVLDSYEDTIVKLKEIHGWSKSYAAAWLINLMIQAAEKKGMCIMAIQHMNKDGKYTGGTFLKHATTGMMEIRIAESGERFVQWAKNRRGGSMTWKPLYFSLDPETGDVIYNEARFEEMVQSKELAVDEDARLEELKDKFDSGFDLLNDDEDEEEVGEGIEDEEEIEDDVS